jgi:hypothetical protein
VIFYAFSPGWDDREDPAIRQLAVQLLGETMGNTVVWPNETTGYAFTGFDNHTYLVVENSSQTPHSATIQLHLPGITAQWGAADLLSGKRIPLKSVGDGVNFTVNLDGAGGTIIVLAD